VAGDGGEPELEARVLESQPRVPDQHVHSPPGQEELENTSGGGRRGVNRVRTMRISHGKYGNKL
jgi:hypothetical protein